ncbi:MAG: hypothetical protein HYR76_08455 [Ignavibacteria bacterium]|nr:hypothetical protein [Ignavibacteria bacterium]
MDKFWKVLVILVLVFGGMLAITLLVPGVKDFAVKLARENNLPLWLVGFAAPILYLWEKVKSVFSNLLGDGSTEKAITKENEDIKAELEKLRQQVRDLDEWRRESIHREITEINRLQEKVSSLEERSRTVDTQIQTAQQRREQLRGEIEEDPGKIFN